MGAITFLVPNLGWELEKMTSFLKNNSTRFEIIITISIAIRIKNDKNLRSYIRASFDINVN